MQEKNALRNLGTIGLIVLIAIVCLIDWRTMGLNLRPGLDIAGGVALIYEIDTTGLENRANIAEEMKTLLQKRVDPQGVYNLTWRVHGSNRLEVQMPLPPAGAAQRREAYVAARDLLFEHNISRGQLERIFRAAPEERAAMIEASAWGPGGRAAAQQAGVDMAASEPIVQQRQALIAAAVERYAAYRDAQAALDAARGADTQPADAAALESIQTALRDASEQLEDAVQAVLATNLDPGRFQNMLELEAKSQVRQNSLAEIRAKAPMLHPMIDDVLARFDEWRAGRGALDGPADLQRLLRGAGVLEFRILADPSPDNPTKYSRYREQLTKEGREKVDGQEYAWFRIDNPLQFFNLNSPSELDTLNPATWGANVVEKLGDKFFVLAHAGGDYGLLRSAERKWSLLQAFPIRDENGRPAVSFGLDVVGGDMFGRLTGRNIGRQLCIFIDDVAYSSATIQSRITTQGQITGEFSPERVGYIVQTMQAGALPARLKDTPVSERTIGSSLGAENLNRALQAGVIGALVVVVLMCVYYQKFGVIAMIAVAMNLLLTMAMLALLQARITLDAIAGLILSIGMCVDANVLINERMREEAERGATLRVAIKNGYDKALSAIIDGNLTTLLTALIIYYVGSQEIRGFGLTLGWGIALNLFTSVFVSRTLLNLGVRYGLVREVKMLRAIPVPTIDWYSRRQVFLTTSLIITVLGLVLVFVRSKQDYLDVEFLGGTTATLELRTAGLNDIDISNRLRDVSQELARAAGELANANIEAVGGSAEHFAVKAGSLRGDRLYAFLAEPLEEARLTVRGGVRELPGGEGIDVYTVSGVTQEQLQRFVRGHAGAAEIAARHMGTGSISSVTETLDPAQRGLLWEFTTTETNKALVQHALASALGDELRVQQRISYAIRGDAQRPFAILDARIENVAPAEALPAGAAADLTDFLGGALILLDQLQPPQPLEELRTRLRNMRLQPGYQDLPWRRFDVFGLTPADDVDGKETFSAVAVAVADPTYNIRENEGRWVEQFARAELGVIRAALENEQALRKVSQFKPQIASQAQAWAITAVIFSWLMIIGYMWVRFGRPQYGVAGVVGLVHTVLVAFAFVGFAGLLTANVPFIANALLIENFKLNTLVLAALLTLIGYAVNDTIVTFDRVREVKGRLGEVTPELINRAINECMSRTILTGTCVLSVLLCMYIWGGSSIRGFNFCMFIGVVAGTYSSIAVASPLLLMRMGGRRSAA